MWSSRSNAATPALAVPASHRRLRTPFGIDISKDIVRRVLAKYYRPVVGTDGPCSHWVMVVMDVFTRRIIGFGVERADFCGASGLSDVQPDHRRKGASPAPEFRS